MNITTTQVDTCKETWLACQELLQYLHHKNLSYSLHTITVIDECACICLGTWNALESEWRQSDMLALLTIGICEECAEVCERYEENAFTQCALKCRQCAAAMTELVH